MQQYNTIQKGIRKQKEGIETFKREHILVVLYIVKTEENKLQHDSSRDNKY